MASSMNKFYLGLIKSPTLDPGLQERIFTYATSTKANALLGALAAHPDLLPSLDERLGKISAASVRTAWAARPERTVAELEELAVSDKRASVLVDLAARTDLTDEAYRRIGAQKHVKVAGILLGNESVPMDVRAQAATILGGASHAGYSAAAGLDALVADLIEFHEALTAGSSNLAVMAITAGTSELSEETQLHILKVVKNRLAEPNGYVPWDVAAKVAMILEKLSGNLGLTPAAIQALQSLPNPQDTRLRSVLIKARQQASSSSRTPRQSPLAAARAATSEQDLKRFAHTAVANKDQGLANTVLCNPSVTASIAEIVSPLAHTAVLARLVRTHKSSPDILAAFFTKKAYLLSDAVLKTLPNPVDLLAKIALNLAQAKLPLPRHLLHSQFVSVEMVKSLPVHCLIDEDLPLLLRPAIAELLLEAFGTREECWETFETLGDQFPGRLEELIGAVVAIVGETLPEDLPQVVTEEQPDAPDEPVVVCVPAQTGHLRRKVSRLVQEEFLPFPS